MKIARPLNMELIKSNLDDILGLCGDCLCLVLGSDESFEDFNEIEKLKEANASKAQIAQKTEEVTRNMVGIILKDKTVEF